MSKQFDKWLRIITFGLIILVAILSIISKQYILAVWQLLAAMALYGWGKQNQLVGEVLDNSGKILKEWKKANKQYSQLAKKLESDESGK